MPAAGYDISASASASSSSSTGAIQFGNVNFGTAANQATATPSNWIWPLVIGAIAVLWLMKRKR